MLYVVQYMDTDLTGPDVLYAGSDAIQASQAVRKVVESWGDVSDIKANPLGEVEIGAYYAMLYNPFKDTTYRVWTDEYDYIPAPPARPVEKCKYLDDGYCLKLSDDTFMQPCIEGPCPFGEAVTNADRVFAGGIEVMAEYGVHGCIPAGCMTPAWYGHFSGYAGTKEDAVQREIEWLQQPAPEEGEQNV